MERKEYTIDNRSESLSFPSSEWCYLFKYLPSLLARKQVVLWAPVTGKNEKAWEIKNKANAYVHKKKVSFHSTRIQNQNWNSDLAPFKGHYQRKLFLSLPIFCISQKVRKTHRIQLFELNGIQIKCMGTLTLGNTRIQQRFTNMHTRQ